MSDTTILPKSDRDAHDIAHLKLVPRRHLGRKITAAVVLLLVGLLIRAFVVGEIEWRVVGQFLFAPVILKGIWNTLLMTVCAMSLGIFLGVVIAIMRISGNPVLEVIALVYIWIFRGAPALLQLLLWFNLALIFPTIGIPGLFQFNTVEVMTPFVAAMLGLGIQQGAYTSEVVRSGLLSVDSGQYEAAQTIGMTRMQTLRRIVLPQVSLGMLSGSLIVFGLSASAFAIPGLLGGRRLKMAATLVYDEYMAELNWPLGATIAIIVLVANLVIMLGYNRLVETRARRALG